MQSIPRLVPNGDGWQLSLHQSFDPSRLRPGSRPVLVIPGYGTNSTIYSYHPSGASLEAVLVGAGLEVWRADLRGQGDSRRDGGSEEFGLEALARRDLSALLDAVLAGTRTGARQVDLVGGSLGGTLVFAHAVLEGTARLGSLVCVGTPVRWTRVHPAVRVLFGSPRLVGMVRVRGSRRLAGTALPLLARAAPWLLSVYLNPKVTDVGVVHEFARAIEDPSPALNREIAAWIRARDLVFGGVNVSEGLARLTNPLLCLLAPGDGIVPPQTAAFPYEQIGSTVKRLIEVGSPRASMAHADLFVAREAHRLVFAPIRDFLLEQPPAG